MLKINLYFDIFNIETVPSLYNKIRPGARYFRSLYLLNRVKEINPRIFTKSGLMLGLGEEKDEVLQLMDDLRSANVDFLPTYNILSIKYIREKKI